MTADQLALLFNYGVLGLVVVGFLTGQIHSKSRVDREVDLGNKLLADNEKTIDALNRLTDAVNQWRAIERRQ